MVFGRLRVTSSQCNTSLALKFKRIAIVVAVAACNSISHNVRVLVVCLICGVDIWIRVVVVEFVSLFSVGHAMWVFVFFNDAVFVGVLGCTMDPGNAVFIPAVFSTYASKPSSPDTIARSQPDEMLIGRLRGTKVNTIIPTTIQFCSCPLQNILEYTFAKFKHIARERLAR